VEGREDKQMNPDHRLAVVSGSALLALLLVGFGGSALAGPNAGGVLVVHDAGLNPTCDPIILNPVPQCSTVDNTLDPLLFWCPTWKVYAAFPTNSRPRLKALRWGIDWTQSALIQAHAAPSPDPQAVVVQATPGWPGRGTGVDMTFDTVRTAEVVELYCFVGYAYYHEQLQGTIWSTTPHPTGPTVFRDDSDPLVEDPIADFGTIGFGVAGYTPCAQPVPVVETRWGRIKADYRR
jgi:hypothetical protein